MLPFRAFQIVVNSLMFILLTFAGVELVVDTRWLFNGQDVRSLIFLSITIASMIALVGSIRLNLQILRDSNLQYRPARSLWGHLFSLIFVMALLYIAFQWRTFANLTYDSHLSTHYLNIALPDWSWLRISPFDEKVSIQDLQIINLIFYLVIVVFLVTTTKVSVSFNRTDTPPNKVSASLVKYHIASGIIFFLLAGVCLYAFIDRLVGYRTQVEFDPNMMNLSNLAGFGFQLVNALLLSLYGQWILRDGLRLRKFSQSGFLYFSK